MTLGRVAILGPGLMGGSLALALTERRLVDHLSLQARNEALFPEIRARLPEASLTTDPRAAVEGADIVILCAPIECMADLTRRFLPALQAGTLVTDVGSVKEKVDRELAPLLHGKALWIGGHPMAGSEKTGFAMAKADLFQDATVILTPTKSTAAAVAERARLFWEALGGRILLLDPATHDTVVAQVSHLPHLLAAELLRALSPDSFSAAGAGLRDTTRVASGPPDLWTEIIWANRHSIGNALQRLVGQLQEAQELLKTGDKSRLHEILQTAHDLRSQLLSSRP
jgi:prephenate dehydrogenase